MLQSPALFEKVGGQLQPPLSAKELSRRLELTLDRNNDVVTVTANGRDRDATVGLVNQFNQAAITYTQTLQRQEAVEADDYVTHQLAQVEAELATERAAVPAILGRGDRRALRRHAPDTPCCAGCQRPPAADSSRARPA